MTTLVKHWLSTTQSTIYEYPGWSKLAGIVFTLVIACAGYVLSKSPGFDHVGQLACAILLAVVYRQFWGYPEQLRAGIQFSAKRLLRLAIILFGLKLNIDIIFNQGLTLLVYDTGTIVFSIATTLVLAKLLKADMAISILLGIGTGVCGAAAIAAVSSIIRAEDEDTAIGVGIIALVGTIFAVGYTLLRPLVHLTSIQYGIWSGISLHEIAHVALAAAPAGQDALAIGLLAKLGRVFLLVPLSFILMYWMKRTGKNRSDAPVDFPWFLVGFIAMSLLGSYVFGKYIILPHPVTDAVSDATTLVLTMAMVGLGLNVSLRDLRTKALKPLLAMTVTSLLLSVLTLQVL
ncbi:MAG: putative sulfate exporter family transporter [Negativicutes bacterium]|nr:putative sulfate exporter family transporter [Negativicutes bacterium]